MSMERKVEHICFDQYCTIRELTGDYGGGMTSCGEFSTKYRIKVTSNPLNVTCPVCILQPEYRKKLQGVVEEQGRILAHSLSQAKGSHLPVQLEYVFVKNLMGALACLRSVIDSAI